MSTNSLFTLNSEISQALEESYWLNQTLGSFASKLRSFLTQKLSTIRAILYFRYNIASSTHLSKAVQSELVNEVLESRSYRKLQKQYPGCLYDDPIKHVLLQSILPDAIVYTFNFARGSIPDSAYGITSVELKYLYPNEFSYEIPRHNLGTEISIHGLNKYIGITLYPNPQSEFLIKLKKRIARAIYHQLEHFCDDRRSNKERMEIASILAELVIRKIKAKKSLDVRFQQRDLDDMKYPEYVKYLEKWQQTIESIQQL